MLDVDLFNERAAIMEFDGGLSRFAAETAAAEAQGFTRWEAINAIRIGHTRQGRDHGQADARHAAHDLPGVQPASQEQDRPMPKRDIPAGRRGVALLALRA